MNHATLAFVLIGCFVRLPAQDGIDRVLAQIEKNSTTLQAWLQQNQAEKLGARTGSAPADPQVELGLLRGPAAGPGRRTDFAIRQEFDFPATYVHRARQARARHTQLEWEFQRQRRALLLEARLLCLDLVYRNALQTQLEQRLQNAGELAAAFQTAFDRGEASILELNKVQLSLLNTRQEAEANEIERAALQAELARMNGGIPLELPDDRFPPGEIPEDFELWYKRAEQSNPQLQWLRSEVARVDEQVKLERALGLPKLAIGFMSEAVAGERFRGLTAGISLPLFERRYALPYGKALARAARSVEADGKLQFYNQMKALHDRAAALQQSARDYRSRLSGLDGSRLLRRALDLGEISLLEYLLELAFYSDSAMRLLQAERDLGKALAMLTQQGAA